MEPLDLEVRRAVYEVALTRGSVPSVADLAATLGRRRGEIDQTLRRLAEAHMLVLQRESGEILMANPFSAVPTSFIVETSRFRAYGNCIWDALGIAAMARSDAVILTACGCCGESMQLHAEDDSLREREGIVHYAVPARQWWEDIVFT